MIKWSIWAFDCEMEENDMNEYTLPVLEPVFRATAVEQGRNRENQQQKEKPQFKTKLQKKMEEEEEVRVKAYPSYDAYARKVTVYPFRSNGYEV